MPGYDAPMLALLEATAAAAAAQQALAPALPVVQGQGSPDLRWHVPAQAMGHGLLVA